MESTYAKLSIPRPLYEAVSDFIQRNPRCGYRSPTDFVIEAVRMRLEMLGYVFGNEDDRPQEEAVEVVQ